MSFTKKPIKVDLSARGNVESIREKKVVTELTKGGSVRNRVVVEDKPIEKLVDEMSVFIPADYTLENLLAAGVPLDRVNTLGLIHTNDKAEIEEKLTPLINKSWDKLQYIDWNEMSTSVENNEVKTNE